jgi:hypothetical protein
MSVLPVPGRIGMDLLRVFPIEKTGRSRKKYQLPAGLWYTEKNMEAVEQSKG